MSYELCWPGAAYSQIYSSSFLYLPPYSRELHFPGSLNLLASGSFQPIKGTLGSRKRKRHFHLSMVPSLTKLWLLFLGIFFSCCPYIVTELVASFINFRIMVPSPVWLLSNAVVNITNSLH